MKKLILTLALLIGLAIPAFAQTYSNGYISIPKEHVNYVSVTEWKGPLAWMGVSVSFKFTGPGLCNSDWYAYKRDFQVNYKKESDKERIIFENTLQFYTKSVNAGSSQVLGGFDRLMLSAKYGKNDPELAAIAERITEEFGNSDYVISQINYPLQRVVSYSKKQ